MNITLKSELGRLKKQQEFRKELDLLELNHEKNSLVETELIKLLESIESCNDTLQRVHFFEYKQFLDNLKINFYE